MNSVPLKHLLKIGAETLQTTAQTLSGAVNELKTALGNTLHINSTGIADGSYLKYNGTDSEWVIDNDLPNKFDGWTSTQQVVQSGNNLQVVFDNLDNSYGYELFCKNKAVTILSETSTSGSVSGIKITYVLSDAAVGDYCKLRILK